MFDPLTRLGLELPTDGGVRRMFKKGDEHARSGLSASQRELEDSQASGVESSVADSATPEEPLDSKTGRERGRIPGEDKTSLSQAPAPGVSRRIPSGASRPALYEVSAREREDDRRRDHAEWDEPFFCNDPFGEWIQSILDDNRGRPG